ncbi:tyrosine-type recombinase/integrase [Sunxiuqinia sp. A32]|uniref:tyrosine-type recombinase/integrase n=1 Tax=Sunxiuqinia sp. A32 TaxID=3461496 RepID=UPI0040464BD6
MKYNISGKKGKKVSVIFISDAVKIVEKYSYRTTQKGYLFPILDKRRHLTAQQKHNRIRKVLGNTDRALKQIAKLAKINMNLSTYVARHSFATILKNSGINFALISEALGHSELSKTQIYLDSIENSQVNEAMKHLL